MSVKKEVFIAALKSSIPVCIVTRGNKEEVAEKLRRLCQKLGIKREVRTKYYGDTIVVHPDELLPQQFNRYMVFEYD